MTAPPDFTPDFVVLCEQHRTPYVVQKYKWTGTGWVPVRKTTTRKAPLLDNSEAKFWDWFGRESPHGGTERSHHETICGATNCRNKLAADERSLDQLFWRILASRKACVRAKGLGVEPNPHAAAFAMLATEYTTARVTVTLEALRSGLHLLNTPKRKQGELDGS